MNTIYIYTHHYTTISSLVFHACLIVSRSISIISPFKSPVFVGSVLVRISYRARFQCWSTRKLCRKLSDRICPASDVPRVVIWWIEATKNGGRMRISSGYSGNTCFPSGIIQKKHIESTNQHGFQCVYPPVSSNMSGRWLAMEVDSREKHRTTWEMFHCYVLIVRGYPHYWGLLRGGHVM